VRLRYQRWIARGIVVTATAVFAVAAFFVAGPLALVAVSVIGLIAIPALEYHLLTAAIRRLDCAIEARLPQDARRRYEDCAKELGPHWKALVSTRVAESSILLLEKSHPGALAVLRSLPIDGLGASLRYKLLNNLAVAAAAGGDMDAARAAAAEAVACAPPGSRSIVLTTLASVYVHLGLPAEALPMLEEALEEDVDPADRARTLFYLGETHWSLGHRDDARGFYMRASEIAPTGRSAACARERIEQLAPNRS
jgi:tetratricopeptide (TPR) repeat protein